jgi:hypothetical protein
MPEGAETASVTVPVKPYVGETVIVDVVDWLAMMETGVVDVIVMSGGDAAETWKVAVVEWAVAPPVAVTVTA